MGMQDTSVILWQGFGASVRGASHLRTNRPNQDALRIWPGDGHGPPLIVAIADGHGSQRHFRSHIGAQFATRAAIRVLRRDVLERLVGGHDTIDLPAIKRTCEEWLPKVIVREWRRRVLRHVCFCPFSDDEWERLTVTAGEDARAAVEADPAIAYGTTLLAVLVSQTFLLYIQLGDGDILTVAADNQVHRPPLLADPGLMGNETTSLCSTRAWRHMRQYFHPIVDQPPDLVLLASDGYGNSFLDETSFRQVAADLNNAILRDGTDAVEKQLSEWLEATSHAGSGDDITVGLAWRKVAATTEAALEQTEAREETKAKDQAEAKEKVDPS